IRRAHGARTLVHPRVVISVPSGITQVERRAVQESATQAGASKVYLVSEPVAAALGAGLPITEPGANVVVDVGGGTTEIAGITLTGGGALLAGLDRLLNRETQLPIMVSDDPLTCAVRGAGKVLDDPVFLARVAFAP